jgi:nondiscriminating glutamyl-tRNA synthetase
MTAYKFRFAPSPTGDLHLGNVRTAFINWLCAKKVGGSLLLRIDDTDAARNLPGAVEQIQVDLKWLGLDHLPQLEFQSQRFDLYKEIAEGLKKSGTVYECFCTPDELQAEREALMKMGRPPRYMGKCAKLSSEQIAAQKAAGKAFTWRIRVPDARGKIAWNDMVRGPQAVDAAHIGDFILLREDGSPTYNFASIIDDIDLGVTHVMRGEDHVSNTPRQIFIAEVIAKLSGVKASLARGPGHLTFGHIPLVLAHDKTKLSKRNGSKSLRDYEKIGVLPQALRNTLALLCWAPPVGREILNDAELIEAFTTEALSRSPSVFAEEKLLWINSEHLKRIADPAERARWAAPWLESFGEKREAALRITQIIWPELSLLSQIPEKVRPILLGPEGLQPADEDRRVAKAWLESFQADFSSWQKATSTVANAKGKQLFMPLRRALTGQDHGIEMKDLIAFLGETEIRRRLEAYATA